LFDKPAGRWRKVPTALDGCESHQLYGKTVPVMKKELLVGYKRMIRRDTDIEDVLALGG
jgi:hypothetical protein